MMLIDAHAHLDLYDDDLLETALEQIRENRILTLSNSMDLSSYRRNREIGQTCDLVLPIFGVHPWNAPECVDRLEDLRDAIQQSPILGEIGLDYHFVEDAGQYSAQREVFEFFLAAAKEQDKIVNLHTRGAERDTLDLLRKYGIRRGIVHWYHGPADVLRQLVNLGMHFTIGVEILYSDDIRAIAQAVPGELLLTETDNPGGLKWLTGDPGMPSVVRKVLETLADVRGVDVGELERTVQRNFQRLIGDDPLLSEIFIEICQRKKDAE